MAVKLNSSPSILSFQNNNLFEFNRRAPFQLCTVLYLLWQCKLNILSSFFFFLLVNWMKWSMNHLIGWNCGFYFYSILKNWEEKNNSVWMEWKWMRIRKLHSEVSIFSSNKLTFYQTNPFIIIKQFTEIHWISRHVARIQQFHVYVLLTFEFSFAFIPRLHRFKIKAKQLE